MAGFAVAVRDTTETGGDFDLTLTSDPPEHYTAAVADAVFTSICPSEGGMGMVALDGGDDVLTDAIDLTMPTPFGFDLFETSVSELTVSSNGWLTFTPDYTGSSFLRSDLGLTVAPASTDLVMDEICTQRDGDTMTIEWRGQTFGSGVPAEFQAHLSSATGSITFVYGEGHEVASPGFAGLRNEAADVELAYTPPLTANTSILWTPTP